MKVNKMSKKNLALALTLGLTLGMSATSFAAEGDAAVDVAADDASMYNDVPKDHWAYNALEILSKDGVLEGYPDGSFNGDKTMTRYEMAQIIANAYAKRGGAADAALLNGVEDEFGPELKKIKRQVNKNQHAIQYVKDKVDKVNISGFGELRYENNNTRGYDNQNDNDRYYASIKMDYKVNDKWKVRTETEVNHRYSNYRNVYGAVNAAQNNSNHSGNFWGVGRGDSKFWTRVWFEGIFDDKNNIEIGRKWRGMGFQNVAWGEDTDGFTLKHRFTDKLTGMAFMWKPCKQDINQYNMYGIGFQGEVGHGTQLAVNYAIANVNKSGTVIGYNTYDDNSPIYTGMYQGDASKASWATWDDGVMASNRLLSASLLKGIANNLFLWADYSRTNADSDNTATAIKLTYKWDSLQDPGSFQAYLKWHNYQHYGRWLGDTADGMFADYSRGWTIGLKYVFQKNVEGEFMFSHQIRPDLNWDGGHRGEFFDCNLFRAQVDFFF